MLDAHPNIAWITGAGSGIGRACAEALAHADISVALTSRTRSALEKTRKGLPRGSSFIVPADVTNEAQLVRAHSKITRELGAPNMLVNAAGIAKSAPFIKSDAALFHEHLALNLLAPARATQLVLPAMMEMGWGRVVNIASVAGKAGAPYISAYAASKHALLGLTRSVALEVATSGVTVNAVCPSYVDTPMTAANVANIAKKTGRSTSRAMDWVREQNPQGRLVTPQEVASLVAYLCTDAAGGINGQAINIDGGALQW